MNEEVAYFYVYEHWRPDTGQCFYVGKGHGRRATKFKRGRHHGNIERKLLSVGLEIEVRFVAKDLTENEAFALERERIAFWRQQGIRLVNRTDGGEGATGRSFSDEAKRRIGAAHKGKVVTEEVRARQSAAHRGVPYAEGRKSWSFGRAATEERRAKASAALLGKPKTEAHRANISAGLKGRVFSDEHRAKISAAKTGVSRAQGK